MKFFDFLRRKKKIQGFIGYFGLDNWWQSEFSDSERNKILEVYQPMGLGSSSLIEGDISHTGQTAIGLLSGMVGWFYKQENRIIAYKIIAKAESLITTDSSILDIHFLYGEKIKILYKDRDLIPDGLEKAIAACQQQISCSKQSAKGFLKRFKDSSLPVN